MNSRRRGRVCLVVFPVIAGASLAMSGVATGATPNADEITFQDVVVTGTRAPGVEAKYSLAPVQVLSGEDLRQIASSPDLMSALAQVVPSLTMQAYGEDMAGQTLQAKLRGLSPNHTLVLIDGKRRHTTANLAVDPGSPFQGGAGVDLNFIPLEAIDHIEVLTQGAAAQYGSDAIAGVINIILKRNSSGGSVAATDGRYFNGGGKTTDVAGNVGFTPYESSYVNITVEDHHHGHSNVSAADERIYNPEILSTYPDSNLPGVPGYPNLAQIEGDAEYDTKLAALNSGIDLNEAAQLYSFATYGEKNAQSYEFYRPPDLIHYTDPTTGTTTYPLPFGFTPQEGTHEIDYAMSGGLRGVAAQWRWDLASTYGADRLDLYTLNSANAGLYAGGPLTTMNFYDGLLKSTQWTTTLDLNRDIAIEPTQWLNVAFGAEYRRDAYAVGAGVPASYLAGGAQSYAGFATTDSGVHSRRNYAGYLDVAYKPTEQLRIDAAGRLEHYSDFGSAAVGKLSAGWEVMPTLALRGNAGNGFRAPTLAEEFYSSTVVAPTTAFVQLAPNSVGAKLLGLGDGLEPERSVHTSLGLVWTPTATANATLDLYQIAIRNRIVDSGQLVGSNLGTVQSPAINAAIAANGNQLSPDVLQTGLTGINVFTNGVSTRTRGVSLMVDFPFDSRFGHVSYSLGATFNETDVTAVHPTPAQLGSSPLFDATALSDLTTANPRYVVNLRAQWSYKRLSLNFLQQIYGPSAEFENDDGDNPTGKLEYFRSTIGPTPVSSMVLGWRMTDAIKVMMGANNAFNRIPPKLNGTLLAHANNPAYGDVLGEVQYPPFSPFGINGGFYYLRLMATF